VDDLKFDFKKILMLILGVFISVAVWGSFSVIGPSEKAIRVTAGQISPTVYGSGPHFKWPFFSHFERASAKPIKQDVVIEVGPKGAISSDNQTIGLAYTVTWNYDTSRVRELATQYVNRDTLEQLINTTTYEALKAEIGKYTIFDLAKNAGKIASEAREAAIVKAKVFPVVITQVNLTNWDWDDAFDTRIKETMNAQQAVAQAKAETDKVEQEQRAQILKAEAGAQARKASAQGEKDAAILEADAKRAQGQGIADYNKLISQNLDIELKFRQLEIDKIKAGRFNGQEVPGYYVMSPAGTLVEIPSPGQRK
jgi:prohibitin 2